MTTTEQPAAATGIPALSSDTDEGPPLPVAPSESPPQLSPRSAREGEDGRDTTVEPPTASPFENKETNLPQKHDLKRGPTLLKELAPLVAMPPPSNAVTQNRLAKQSYSRLGRNLLFEARPAVVHYGGYIVGKPHSQRVRVVNISRTSQRLHILGPATDFFKMRCNKKGLVAPGSSEIITVDFHPREYRYHYDCLRLHTDSQNLLVPIHAYPVMNDVIFPERLDFGVHALGETVRRTIKMVCKVPIQFEFEIEVTKSHPHFKIGPLRGIIPANGAAEVDIEHTPARASSAEMKLLVNVSQFNFTPIACTVTGAGRPGVVREAALKATAAELARNNALHDSLGPSRNSHAQAQARKLRGRKARERQHQQQSRKAKDSSRELSTPATPGAGGEGGGERGYTEEGGEEYNAGEQGVIGYTRRRGPGRESLGSTEADCDRGWHDTAVGDFGGEEGETGRVAATTTEGAELVDTWGIRPTSAEQYPYHTGQGSGAVFDVGGEWLATQKRQGSMQPAEPWAPPAEGSVFGSVGGPTKTTVVEGLVIPARLDTVQATNFVLTQQPGKLKPKDLKEAIRRTRADRQQQLQEQEALRSLAATGPTGSTDCGDEVGSDEDRHPPKVTQDTERSGRELHAVEPRQRVQSQQPAQLGVRAICAYEAAAVRSSGGVGAATRQLKEMSFLQDLADLEAEERDRTFKASIEHVGEPLLTREEEARALEERRWGERGLQRKRREVERASIATCLKGPGEVGARHAKASLLLTGDGTQGVGFHHKPDWDVYKNDDWGRRRDVLRRLVNAVGAWIVRRRAGRRLAAIQARLGDLRGRVEVAAMVERDNLEAKLTAGPSTSADQASWKSAAAGECGEGDDDHRSTWEFPDLSVTSEALAAEMLSESLLAPMMEMPGGSVGANGDVNGRSTGATGDGYYKRFSGMPIPPPPEFRLSAGDIDRHMFPIYDEGAALSRQEEVVDAAGPPCEFIEIDLLPLREPEEARSMGYVSVRAPGLGMYPSIETSRPLRWSAFEECGVRQPRDEQTETGTSGEDSETGMGLTSAGSWRHALSSTERRQSQATLGRRRSSVGLRMVPSTLENAEEAWLQAAEAELTALAAEAEKVDRMPDALLLWQPPPAGVDLITPDPRYKAFLSELPADEASPEWCLRPQEIPREVPVTKGLLLGYSPGTTTLRAYADAPRLSNSWRPRRERRSSGLACMRGQASRGVWQPARSPTPPVAAQLSRRTHTGFDRPADRGVSGVVDGIGNARDRSRGGGVCRGRGRRGGDAVGVGGARKFQLVDDHDIVAAAAGDGLSDSESEDDDDDTPIPTPSDARTVFDTTSTAGSLEGGQSLRDGRKGASGELETGDGPAGAVHSAAMHDAPIGRSEGFERELAMSDLERTRRKARTSDAEKLADRMGAIGAQVQNIKHAFVLQTPFHRLRHNEPDGS